MAKRKKKPEKPGLKGIKYWTFSSDLLGHMGLTEEDSKAITSFEALRGPERLKAARRVIAETAIDGTASGGPLFPLAIAESESLLKGYATLDDVHRSEITRLKQRITDYLHDPSRKRPFAALMLAAPGAGKSHFIKQLARAMSEDRVQAVTFNMATMQSAEDMAPPVDELRNLKVNDRFPLLFLDEFDSDPSRYAALLPLLWDGELHVGHRDLKLGKALIVLAGSSPDLPKAMDHSAKMRLEADTEEVVPTGKLVDLLSRINGGVINIPDLDLRTEARDRRVDKVCVTVALMKDRFGEDLKTIPTSLLKFVAHTKFRYGVRSIAHFIEVINSGAFHDGALQVAELGLPLMTEDALQDSSLKLHMLDKDQGFGIVNRWNEFSQNKGTLSLEGKGGAWAELALLALKADRDVKKTRSQKEQSN